MTYEQWARGDFLERREISCEELYRQMENIRLRELAFSCCVNMIASAIGNCEFKTYIRGRPEKQAEYYLWNVEPNQNENSSAFWHKLVFKLYSENEALVIPLERGSRQMMVVADTWERPSCYPGRLNEYRGVQAGEESYDRVFYEDDVLHFRLNGQNVKRAVDAIYDSYYRLFTGSMEDFAWSSGRHLKVHVDQVASGQENWMGTFQNMIQAQVKPWLNAKGGVLPEFDGYKYEDFGASSSGTARRDTRDIRALVDDIFDFTAQAFGIPPVLLHGEVAGTQDAVSRWLTTGIDPLAAQISEEITRKRYGYTAWRHGNFVQVDTSTLQHFDIFANASNIEKLIGSGAYSINDVRTATGDAEIAEDWASKHWLTLNIGTIEAAAQAAESQTASDTQATTQNTTEKEETNDAETVF